MLSRHLCQTNINRISQERRHCISKHQVCQSGCDLRLYFIVVELIEDMRQLKHRLRLSPVHLRYSSPLLHKIS